jgi:hypothetical protein
LVVALEVAEIMVAVVVQVVAGDWAIKIIIQ